MGFDEIEYASQTDVGIRRSHNQDAHVLVPATDNGQWTERGHVFLVADGMGAHAVGELASKIAVDNIPHIYSKHAQEGAQPALRKAFVEANVTINNRGKQNREFLGMGTTGTALVLRPEGAWVGHVGDSRAYRVRGGVIEQLSFDHSLLWELARRQRRNPDELKDVPPNVIVRSLGPEALVQVDVEGPHPIEPGDVYLLCSDGLTGLVTDREIGAVVSALPPVEACRFLVHLANMQGGPDNITLIVVRVGGEVPANATDSNSDVVFPSVDMPGPPLSTRLRGVFRQLPWSFFLLFLGIILATAAMYLTAYQIPGGFPVFIVAGMSLFGGLIGLVMQSLRENRPPENPDVPRPLQVYRQAACTVDDALLQKLIVGTANLEESIKAKNWQIDAETYQMHLKHAQEHLLNGRIRDAFREQCRAMMVLMQTVAEQRGHGESFRPLWDRPSHAG
jgi:protein phosphatase